MQGITNSKVHKKSRSLTLTAESLTVVLCEWKQEEGKITQVFQMKIFLFKTITAQTNAMVSDCHVYNKYYV